MARNRNPLRDKAFIIYKEKEGNIKTNEIAKMLEIESSKVSSWKSLDKWDIELGFKSRKRGAQKGNTNAIGNSGGAPAGNYNAFKNGSCISEDKLISNIGKLLPKSMANTLMNLLGENPIDKLWRSILIQESKILTMQKIIRVKNNKDTTKEIKKKKTYKDDNMQTEDIEYEIQFAWDKETAGITALSKAMQTLANMIKQYDLMIHKNWELATEEQRVRIDVLKSKIINSDKSKEDKIDSYFAMLEDKMKE